MSTNSLEQLKQAKTSLKAERKPVSQVQEALIKAKEITEFVSVALSKENRWILQSGEQESIVTMLKEINLTKKDDYDIYIFAKNYQMLENIIVWWGGVA